MIKTKFFKSESKAKNTEKQSTFGLQKPPASSTLPSLVLTLPFVILSLGILTFIVYRISQIGVYNKLCGECVNRGGICTKNQPPTCTFPSTSPYDTETSDWKTYRNEKYEYSVKYPNNWEVTSPFTDTSPEAVRFIKIVKDNGEYLYDVSVDILIGSIPLDFVPSKEWYLNWMKNVPADINTSGFTFETITYLNLVALKVNNNELIFAENSNLFRIQWKVTGNYDQNFVDYSEKIYNQILSTFKFIKSPNLQAKKGCFIGGCNAEICQSAEQEPVFSTCVFRPEYACYKNAVCKKQPSGKCAWTQSAELTSCFAKYRFK